MGVTDDTHSGGANAVKTNSLAWIVVFWDEAKQ